MAFNFLKKIVDAKNKATTYRVGLLQTKAYRTLKDHTTQALAGHGISAADWALLGVLYGEEDGLRAIELADILGVEAPFITATLDSLEGKGLFRRTEDPQDRRAKLVRMTPEGRAFVQRVEKEVRTMTKPLLDGLSMKDLYTYLKVLDRIVKNSLKR